MDDRQSLRLLLPRPLRRLPADLVAMLAVTALVNVAVFAPVIRETPLRVPLGLAFALFVPGYVFIAALFPEAGAAPADDEAAEEAESGFAETVGRSGIDGIERVALAFGLSIAIVPLIGLVLNFTPWGIRLTPIMLSLSGFTVVATAVAAQRRWALPDEERFRVPYREWYGAGRSELLEPETRLDGALNVLLILSIVLAVGVVGFAVLSPPAGEQFSAIYILTENDDGEYVADGYPTEFTQGESAEVIVGIDNHEHETTDYTVVAVEQRTETVVNESASETATGDGENQTTVNETVVTEQQELDRFETTLTHNESEHHTYDLEPTMVGDDVRIVWLLFPGCDVPDEPTVDDTEYHVHLWVDVEE